MSALRLNVEIRWGNRTLTLRLGEVAPVVPEPTELLVLELGERVAGTFARDQLLTATATA